MLISLLSDLHLEFFDKKNSFELPFVHRDILVLAGDVHIGTKADKFILEQLSISDVIYVLGNHEFYHQVLPSVRRAWNSKTTDRINAEAIKLGYKGKLYVLDDKSITFDDITFIGSTLWTSFNNANPIIMNNVMAGMNDYKYTYSHIDSDDYPSKKPITPEYIYNIHTKSRNFIEQELEKDGKKIIVTHHSPTLQSIADCYKGNSLTDAYASNLDHWFYDYDNVVAAFHGHTHTSFDYFIGNTRIVCNPFGYYQNAVNSEFNKNLIIEL